MDIRKIEFENSIRKSKKLQIIAMTGTCHKHAINKF